MAESSVRIEGLVSTSPSGTQDINVTGQPIGTYAVAAPGSSGTYVFSIGNVTGVVASNNFMSIFNPVGSGKTVIFGAAYVSCVAASMSTESTPLRGYRITAASAGTLQIASAIGKFQTTMPNPTAEIRIGNPTVTAGAALFNMPPAISSGTGSTDVHQISAPAGSAQLTLAPGEGVVLQTAVGTVNQKWNISIVWVEI